MCVCRVGAGIGTGTGGGGDCVGGVVVAPCVHNNSCIAVEPRDWEEINLCPPEMSVK